MGQTGRANVLSRPLRVRVTITRACGCNAARLILPGLLAGISRPGPYNESASGYLDVCGYQWQDAKPVNLSLSAVTWTC